MHNTTILWLSGLCLGQPRSAGTRRYISPSSGFSGAKWRQHYTKHGNIKHQPVSCTCLFPIFTEVKPHKSTAIICRHSQFLKWMIPVNVWFRQVTVVRQVQQCKAILVMYDEAALLTLPVHHCNTHHAHSSLSITASVYVFITIISCIAVQSTEWVLVQVLSVQWTVTKKLIGFGCHLEL